MRNAIKQRVTVQPGGRIEVFVPELPEGTTADVIVLETARDEPSVRKTTLSQVIGAGRGAFTSPQEVDQFIRAERDQWM